MNFTPTLINVLMMLAYAIPGYIFVKTSFLRSDDTKPLAKVLLYLCQPCLSLYSFNKATYSRELLGQMGVFFVVSAVLQLLIIAVFYFVYRKKYNEDAKYRVLTVATTFGNVGFFGVPLLEALLPQYPNAIAMSATFIVSMNIIAWTIGCFILTGDKKYFSVKKLFLNPPVLTLIIALPLFLTCTKLPSIVESSVSLLGKMTTPLCMIILGMRLATVRFRDLISDWRVGVTSVVKLVAMPLVGYALVYFLPLPEFIKYTLVILCCCPTASVVLSLSEINGYGQKTAANVVLLSTILCAVTIPVMLLILCR